MSLVNKMLKDLSDRERSASDVMQGIAVPGPAPRRGSVLGRILGLLVIVGAATAVMWYLYGPKQHAAPKPRASLQAAAQQAAALPPAEPVPASPPAEAGGGLGNAAGTRTRSGLTIQEAFDAAREAQARGDNVLADHRYSEVLLADPTVNPAREGLVAARMDTGRLADARRVLNRGLELDPGHPPFAALDQRLRQLESGAADAPATPRPASVEEALRAGSPAVVERRLIDLLVADKRTHAAREALVDMRIDQGRLADARRSLNIGLGVAPQHEPYLRLDRRLSALEGGAANARRARQSEPAAQAPEPATPPPAAVREPDRGPPLEPAAAEARALELLERGGASEAADIVRRTQAAYPDWEGYRRVAARIELAREQPAAALRILEVDPPAYAADPEYHGLMAAAYQRLDQHKDASRVYRALVAAQPNEGRWWAGYAISREALGDREEAVHAYGQALRRGNLDHRVRAYVTERLDALRTAR